MGSSAALLPTTTPLYHAPRCSFLPPFLASPFPSPSPPDHFSSRHSLTSNGFLPLFLRPFSPAPLSQSSPSLSDFSWVSKCQQFQNGNQSESQESQDSVLQQRDLETISFDREQGEASALDSSQEAAIADASSDVLTEGFAEEELIARFSKQVAVDSTSKFGTTAKYRDFETTVGTETDFQGGAEADGSFSRPRSPVDRQALLAGSVAVDGYQRLPINLDLDLYHARCFFRNGDNSTAEAILRQCMKDWPGDGRAYVALGRRLMKQGKFVDARAIYEDGCQALRGENPFIWQAWAILEEKSGHISKARTLFDAATAADIKHAAAWHGWAVLELRQGSTRKARDLLSKGIKYCGPNEYLFQTFALIEYKAGKLNEARALLDQATRYNPKSCASWQAWALLEANQSNNSTARHLFQKGVRASPKNRYVWQAWALFEAKQGNEELARKLFQQGHELNPRDAVLLQSFALFEYESTHLDVARDLFEQAASVDPKHQPVWLAWGWVEWKEGNLDAAREYYKRCLSLDSGSLDAARAFQAWGILEERAGKYLESRELFKCALKVDSQNAAAWMSWAKLEENIGNTIRAEEIRNLYLQQRTEIVEDVPWDMSLTNMLAPAIDRIKGFLKMESQPKNQVTVVESSLNSTTDLNKETIDFDTTLSDPEFDIESFFREVCPWKYSSGLKNAGGRTRSRFFTTGSQASYSIIYKPTI